MKNLFKNLMLVAVAAMAFTACSEDNNEVNKAEKKVVYEFVASFEDDTRSGFTGSEVAEDGTTIYHSAWTGGETVLLVSNTGEQKTATVDADGHFTAEFTGAVSQVNMYSPASAWAVDGTYAVSTIPAVQTSGVQSVDPAAHIVSGYTMIDTEGTQLITLTLSHAHAYGKMTVNAPEGFEIDYVELDLKGDFYDTARENSYKLYASEETPNLFWFTTEYMTVDEFTLTAYDAEGKALTKTVNMADKEKPLAFSYAKVSTFSVSGLEEPVAPSFSGAAVDGSNYNDFDIYFSDKDNKLATLKLNPCSMASPDWTIAPGTYYFSNYGNAFYTGEYSTYGYTYLYGGKVEISVVNGQYHFEFINLADQQGNVVLDYATYTGEIAGLNVPDVRTPLATPTIVTATAEANIITISWDPVEGADGYRVKLNSPSDESFEEVVYVTEYVYEAKSYNTKYSFTIMSYASDENENKSSGDAYIDVTTGRDPNAVVPVFTHMSFVRTDVTYAYYSEYCNVFELTNSDGYKMELCVNSHKSSETHIDEGSYYGSSKGNLGFSGTPTTFLAKVWAPSGYIGLANTDASAMIVSKSGDVYNIDFTLVIEGVTHFFSCNAPIGGDDNTGEGGDDNTGDGGDDNTGEGGDDSTDVVPDGFTKVDFVSATQGSYVGRQYNWMGDFKFSYMGEEVSFSMCDYNGPMQMSNKDIKPGTYVNNGNGANMETKELYNISVAGMPGNSGSQVEVSKDGNIYTFLMTIKASYSTYKFYYKGEI